jgi:hypothetical protein
MISRIWHGYTTAANADVYETLLREEQRITVQEMSDDGERRPS